MSLFGGRMKSGGGYGMGGPSGDPRRTRRAISIGGGQVGVNRDNIGGIRTFPSGGYRRTNPPTRMGPQGAPQMPYRPETSAAHTGAAQMQQIGTGLADPTSNYSRRMRDELSRDIGARAGAQGRMAALRAARAGMGGGASPELLDIQGDISRAGLEAAGEAGSELMLRGPELASRFLNPALSANTALQGQALQGFLAQQGLELDREQTQAQIDMRQRELELEEARRAEESMIRELMMLRDLYGF